MQCALFALVMFAFIVPQMLALYAIRADKTQGFREWMRG
jgi:hypothetical protein